MISETNLSNVKFMDVNGRRVVIIRRDVDKPDFSRINGGTYNYGTRWFGLEHYFKDVVPYYYIGNGPVQPSSCECQNAVFY